MLRSWLGDWIGTFIGKSFAHHLARAELIIGHKGAVWSSKISLDTSRAVTGSADFTA
jgi:serine-threonine kinase receptor-associated protein